MNHGMRVARPRIKHSYISVLGSNRSEANFCYWVEDEIINKRFRVCRASLVVLITERTSFKIEETDWPSAVSDVE
jgi:hypothetical protein